MKSKIDIEVIKRVKRMRAELNISQRTLAEILDVSQSFIGQVESSNYATKYSVNQVYQIAKFFGCKVSDLFPPINPLEP